MDTTSGLKSIEYLKVNGTLNPADALTKHLAEPLRVSHFERLNLQFLDGRANAAPELYR